MVAKFGTSGLRGLATELVGAPTRSHVWAFAQLLLARNLVNAGDAICVARDFRSSSPALMADVVLGLQQAGLSAIDCGTVPTPALVLYAMARGASSIMITGSHIPADRNGLKFYLPTGEIDKLDETEIVKGAAAWPGNPENLDTATPQSEKVGAAREFVRRYVDFFGSEALRGLRIGVYQHSTVARDLLIEVLERTGAEVTPLARSVQFIPVDTEAVSSITRDLVLGWCSTGAFDAIVSADGDGDRPLLAAADGSVVRGDVLGLLTARFLGAEVVVTPITSNSGLEAALPARVVRTQVGSPFVIAGMQGAAGSAVAGFEANGGFLCQTAFTVAGRTLSPLPTRDSFLPLLVVLRQAAVQGASIASLEQQLQLPVAHADRLENFATVRARAIMAKLTNNESALARFLDGIGAVASVNTIDGLRITLEDKRIVHLRPSGNAPEFRCYAEARTQVEAEQLVAMVFERLQQLPG
jgi:phosphomannomutase